MPDWKDKAGCCVGRAELLAVEVVLQQLTDELCLKWRVAPAVVARQVFVTWIPPAAGAVVAALGIAPVSICTQINRELPKFLLQLLEFCRAELIICALGWAFTESDGCVAQFFGRVGQLRA